jgi:hypothetical protein
MDKMSKHALLFSEIQISMTVQNPNMLFYCCRKSKCNWFKWSKPLSDDAYCSQTIDCDVSEGDSQIPIMEEEVNNMKKEVNDEVSELKKK